MFALFIALKTNVCLLWLGYVQRCRINIFIFAFVCRYLNSINKYERHIYGQHYWTEMLRLTHLTKERIGRELVCYQDETACGNAQII